jgi:hypothetical protein
MRIDGAPRQKPAPQEPEKPGEGKSIEQQSRSTDCSSVNI